MIQFDEHIVQMGWNHQPAWLRDDGVFFHQSLNKAFFPGGWGGHVGGSTL